MRYGAHSRMEGALPPSPRSPPLYPCDDSLTFIPRKAWGRVTDTPPRCVGTNVRQVHRAPCIATATAPACTPFSYIIKQHSMQQNAPLHPTIEKSHENTTSRERQEREHGSLRYHYERIRRISHTCTAAARKQLRTRRESTLSTLAKEVAGKSKPYKPVRQRTTRSADVQSNYHTRSRHTARSKSSAIAQSTQTSASSNERIVPL